MFLDGAYAGELSKLKHMWLEPGAYKASWFGALTGERIALPEIYGPLWTSPEAPDQNDWALLLLRK